METIVDALGLDVETAPDDSPAVLETPAEPVAAATPPAAEAAVTPPAEAKSDAELPPRDNQGRFSKTDLDITPPNKIPLATLLDERRQWREELAARDARIKALEEATKPKEPEIPVPQFEVDPKGYVDAKAQLALKALEQVKEVSEAQKQQNAHQELLRNAQVAEADFAKDNADYYSALDHARNVRLAQLQLMSPDIPEQELRQYVAQEELQLAQAAFASKRNPAQVAYQMAKAMGYTPIASRASAPAPAAPVTAAQSAKERQMPPDVTLGKVAGTAPDQNDVQVNDDELGNILESAIAERFGRKRA